METYFGYVFVEAVTPIEYVPATESSLEYIEILWGKELVSTESQGGLAVIPFIVKV